MPPPLGLDKFDEAVEWFRERVPMSEAEWNELNEMARRQAFKVSGVAQLNVVEAVWEEIDRAVESGESMAMFSEKTMEKLLLAWKGTVKDPAWRVENIFRTNTQMAYGAGRYKQQTQPAVMRMRPFWRYDAVLDNRTSDICRPIAGTVLPADHPFWKTHVPPCHFSCRATIDTLTEAQAKQYGLTTRVPDAEPLEGFGLAPGEAEWEPDLSDTPKPLAKIYRSKE